ncbi:MAG: CoA protein activase [Dethiobacteria bacterium]
MKITFPHMGSLWIPLKGLFNDLGFEVVPPPPVTKRTITLGARHSPEFACLPFKINVGNFIESLEQGADTIVMGGGCGPCRFGYYAQVEKEILLDLGYNFEMIVIEPPQGNLIEWLGRLRLFGNNCHWREITAALLLAWHKIKVIDRLHRLLLWARPRGSAEKITNIYNEYLTKVDQAQNLKLLKKVDQDAQQALKKVVYNKHKQCLRIALVGEIFMLLEPFVNLNIEQVLGERGVEVERSIYLSDWIRDHILSDPRRIRARNRFKKAARPFLNHFIGGHGWESIGESVLYAERGFDGAIHILPFTCTPEIVAQSILPRISKCYDFPIVSFSLDEHSGLGGFITRLEAFLDLLSSKKIKHGTRWDKPCAVFSLDTLWYN